VVKFILSVGVIIIHHVGYCIQQAMPLKNTEGMIDASIFPINYFAVKQLGYFHEDAEEGIAKALKDL